LHREDDKAIKEMKYRKARVDDYVFNLLGEDGL
jgi:hypothetical protein